MKNIISIQINNTIIRLNAKVVPALGLLIGAEKFKYSNRKHTEIYISILCFLFEIEITKHKEIITPKK